MLEKLLENWLDNASELSYQAVFVQMLAADGYRVLHSTRHCTLEYGKDVLAVAPDGVGCVFQLKGDPKGKMNVNTFRSIQLQLVQMLTQRPSYPGFPVGKFRAYLVSNGEFNEEVQVAARELNDAAYPAKLELWSRGMLLDLCKRHASALWPSEIPDNRALLELYMADAEDPLPTKTLADMLASILSLSEPNLKGLELDRAVSSACWATGIALSNFAERRNFYALACGWMLCWALIRAASMSHGHDRKRVKEASAICEGAILDALVELWGEVKSGPHLGRGNPLVDMEIYPWRVAVIVGLLSTLVFAASERSVISDTDLSELKVWLLTTEEKPALWGEGAVSQLLPWVMIRRRFGDPDSAKALLLTILVSLVSGNVGGDSSALPTPYYTFDQIRREQVGARVISGSSRVAKETFRGSSYCADLLLRSAVQLGYLEEAKKIWPHFTKLSHRYFEFPATRDYWMHHATQGAEVTRIYPNTYEVDALKADMASSIEEGSVVTGLPSELWLLLMWWQAAPHRITASTAFFAFERAGNPEEGA